MRAKTVSFERGRDPKQSMGVGMFRDDGMYLKCPICGETGFQNHLKTSEFGKEKRLSKVFLCPHCEEMFTATFKLKESLEFERGKDPKEALDIGILNRAKEDMREKGYSWGGPDSLLTFAAEFDYPEYVDLAMAMGANIYHKEGHVMELAAVAGSSKAMETLLNHGGNPDWISDYTYKYILPSPRNKRDFMKMSKRRQDQYIRISELLKTHPNFTR